MRVRLINRPADSTPEPAPVANVEAADDIPEGWAVAHVRDLMNLVNGLAFKPSQWTSEGLPIIRIQNLNRPDAPFNRCSDDLPEKFLARHGDLLFAWSGTPGTSFGAHIWMGGDAWVNQHIFRVEFHAHLFDKRFLRHAINRNLEDYIEQAHGGVGLAHITKGKFEASTVMVPPLAEQRRIAEAVEALQEKIGAARARLERVPAILRRFRQAVLSAACSGRLTEDWRDPIATDDSQVTSDEGQLPIGWVLSRAGDYYIDARYGTSVKCDYSPMSGVPIVRIPNIASGSLTLEDIKYGPLTEREIQTLRLRAGDLVVCRTNGSLDLVGKAAIIPDLNGDFGFASYLIRLRLDSERLIPDYFYLCLSGDVGRSHIEQYARTTAGQFNLNLEILRTLPVPLPPFEEQQEIVRRVGALFALADAVERRVAVARQQADALPQAILARAFSGRLVPTEAELARREGRDYEPAAVLLERIRQERAARGDTSGRRRGRRTGPG